MTFIETLWPLGALYLVLVAAFTDIRSMRIPNWISIAVIGLFLVGIPFGLHEQLAGHLIVFGITAAIVLVLFFTGIAGGGDTKLIAALSLWVGPAGIVPFLLVMSLVGGLLGVLALALSKNEALKAHDFKWTDSWFARLSRGEKVVSYGVAIAAGFIAALTKIYV